MRPKRIFVAATRVTALATLAAAVGVAQHILTAKAGLIYFVAGRVSIVGRGPLTIGAAKPLLKPGEILFTEAGRAEVLLNAGVVLRIGDFTRIRMDSAGLTDTRVSIELGSAVVTVTELPKPDHVAIEMGGAVVVMNSGGVYRFDSRSDNDEAAGPSLRVFSGQAEVHREEKYLQAKHGQAIDLRTLHPAAFDRKNTDELQRWAAKRTVPPPFATLAPMICYAPDTGDYSLLPANNQTPRDAAQPNTPETQLQEWFRVCLHK
jgi:hypothetical protein